MSHRSGERPGPRLVCAQPARMLVVPDKFKGTLAAPQVCSAIAAGWKSVRPADHLDFLPMSDGGDGFGTVMADLLHAQPRSVRTRDAAHRPLTAAWWWVPGEKLAIVEAARVVGLALLPSKKFHPFQLDTFGLGRVLEAVSAAGAKNCLIGIGGSATNDAGFGLARALGWEFLDQHRRPIEQWWQLNHLARVVSPGNQFKFKLTVAVDVLNPLLGPRGCSRVYGPQKGLAPEEVPYADQCLRWLTRILEQQLGLSHAKTPGAGAAGGLGYGLMTFASATAQSGFDVFAEAARLEQRIRTSDVVITGEGAIDRQTFMGKGVGQVANLCRKLKRPCVGLAGVVSPDARSAKLFASVRGLTELTDPVSAKKRPQIHLKKLGALAARDFSASRCGSGRARQWQAGLRPARAAIAWQPTLHRNAPTLITP